MAGFYNTGKTITLDPNRAYLVIPAQTLSRGFDLPWDNGDTTSMADELQVSPEEQSVETPYYTLDGRQTSGKPTVKGIYIKDRKKVIIK